jgi:hypothetical protein
VYNNFWNEFIVLFLAAIVGSIAILPYGLRLAKEVTKKKPLKIPQPTLLIISVLQNAVLFAVVTGIGLIVQHNIGLSNPFLERIITGQGMSQTIIHHLMIAFLLGIGAGSILLVMDILFLPYLPKKLLDTALKTTTLENVMASFYGGINEELLTRLFGISVVAWLLSRMWHTDSGLPTAGVYWIANIVLALLFALGHVPTLKAMVGTISPMLLARTLLLNMAVGIICGWVFWNYGIVAAMIVHFIADIVYHGGGTFILRATFIRTTK